MKNFQIIKYIILNNTANGSLRNVGALAPVPIPGSLYLDEDAVERAPWEEILNETDR